MKLPRRKFLHLAAGAAALPAASRSQGASLSGAAGDFIVFVPAGGTPDIIARLIGQSLSQRLGQSLVIDNRPGGGGIGAAGGLRRRPTATRSLSLLRRTPSM